MENKISYLRLLLEFGQEPLWWYDSDSDVIDVGLIPEWEEDIELNDIMYQLSDAYDALFINTKHEFAYVGFKTDEQKLSFLKLADLFATKVYEKLSSFGAKIFKFNLSSASFTFSYTMVQGKVALNYEELEVIRHIANPARNRDHSVHQMIMHSVVDLFVHPDIP